MLPIVLFGPEFWGRAVSFDFLVAEGIIAAQDRKLFTLVKTCLLYTSDAADERSSVDLGGRRIIKKKKMRQMTCAVLDDNLRMHLPLL